MLEYLQYTFFLTRNDENVCHCGLPSHLVMFPNILPCSSPPASVLGGAFGAVPGGGSSMWPDVLALTVILGNDGG